MEFDGTLTMAGEPYWQKTHFDYVETIASRYGISVKKKKEKTKEIVIKNKHGQIKKVIVQV